MDKENNAPLTPEADESEIRAVRINKLEELCARGENPYAQTRFVRTHTSEEIKQNVEALTGQTVRLAGRLVSKRIMGKASFAHILDLK